MIEIYPRGTQLDRRPGRGARRRRLPAPPQPGHMAIATEHGPRPQICAIAAREGWPARHCLRGGRFGVIELWVEGCQLVEVLTPEMQRQYLDTITIENWERMLAEKRAADQAAEAPAPLGLLRSSRLGAKSLRSWIDRSMVGWRYGPRRRLGGFLFRLGHDQRPVRRGGEAGLGRVGELDPFGVEALRAGRSAPGCARRTPSARPPSWTSNWSSKSRLDAPIADHAAAHEACISRSRRPPPRRSPGCARRPRAGSGRRCRSAGAIRRRLSRAILCSSLPSRLVLEITTSSPVTARIRVDLRPIFSTVPEVWSQRIESPRRNGLSKMIDKRREQVVENALGGEADGDAADAEAGDQAGDVDAEIVEHDDDGDDEDGDGDEQADDADRAAEAAARLEPAGAVLDHAEDQLARPRGDLQGRRRR